MIYEFDVSQMTPDLRKREEMANLVERAFHRRTKKNFGILIVSCERKVRNLDLFGRTDNKYSKLLHTFFGAPDRKNGDVDWTKFRYKPEKMKEDGRHTTYEEIGKMCEMKRFQVITALRRLEKCGLITRRKHSQKIDGCWHNEVVLNLNVDKLREFVELADSMDGKDANRSRIVTLAKKSPEEKARVERDKQKKKARALEKKEEEAAVKAADRAAETVAEKVAEKAPVLEEVRAEELKPEAPKSAPLYRDDLLPEPPQESCDAPYYDGEKAPENHRENGAKVAQTEISAENAVTSGNINTCDDFSSSSTGSNLLVTSFLVPKGTATPGGGPAPFPLRVACVTPTDSEQEKWRNDPPSGVRNSLPEEEEKHEPTRAKVCEEEKHEPTRAKVSGKLYEFIEKIQNLFGETLTYDDACCLNKWVYEAPKKTRLTPERFDIFCKNFLASHAVFSRPDEQGAERCWSLETNVHFFCQSWGAIWVDLDIRVLAKEAQEWTYNYLVNPEQTVSGFLQEVQTRVAMRYSVLSREFWFDEDWANKIADTVPDTLEFWLADWSKRVSDMTPGELNLGRFIWMHVKGYDMSEVIARYGAVVHDMLQQHPTVYRALKVSKLPVDRWIAPFRGPLFDPIWKKARAKYMEFEYIRKRLAKHGLEDTLDF